MLVGCGRISPNYRQGDFRQRSHCQVTRGADRLDPRASSASAEPPPANFLEVATGPFTRRYEGFGAHAPRASPGRRSAG